MKTAVINGSLTEIIDYNPRPHQSELDSLIWNRARCHTGPKFFVPVDHRRSGKSSGVVNSLIKLCSPKIPELVGQYYYFYPQQKKIREHIWDNPEILPKYLPMSQVQKKDDQRMVIFFKSGSQLIFDGTDENPDKHRGGNGRGYVIDEYDDQQKRVFTEIVRPIIDMNKGFAVLGGTPRGVKQLHDAYQAGQDPLRVDWWSRLLTAKDSTNADGSRLISDEELENILKDYQAEGIGETFYQEYYCKFIQGEAQVFRKLDQVVRDKFDKLLEIKEPEPNRYYVIGSDPAITHDYWVNSVIDLHTFEEVYLERFQPFDTNLGEARTEALARKYNNAVVKGDVSGIGKPIFDHLKDKGITVDPLPTGILKERLITNLSLLIDALQVRFLPDEVGMAEMRDFTFNRLPSGRYQFEAPEGKHDDVVIARALACYNIGQPLGLGDISLPNSIFGDTTRNSNSYYGQLHKIKQ
jgi:hypothetical protein